MSTRGDESRLVSGTMKEYKLSGWPDLAAPYQRTCYRRMLSDMSHRYMSLSQLTAASSATRLEVRNFLSMLAERGLLSEREGEPDNLLGSLGEWFRRTVGNQASPP